MSGFESITELERVSMQKSPFQCLDGRVKLLVTLAITFYAVYTTDIMILLVVEAYLLILMLVSKIPFKESMIKILLILPLGGAIAIFQPFVHPGTIIYSLPLGINVTSQGVEFGLLLLARLVVSITCIVLLSSLSPMQEVVDSFKKLGMPRDLAMIFSLFIRYLFMFYDELQRIRHAQASRNFDIFSKKTAYMWRLKQVAYTIAMMFLRAFEKGETVYFSMLSRGYSEESDIYTAKQKLGMKDFTFVSTTLALIVCLEFIKYVGVI